MTQYLVDRTFRHLSGDVARFVAVQVVTRNTDTVIQSLTTDSLGHVATYLDPGQYDWKALGARIPFDVINLGAGVGHHPHHQSTPAAQWNIIHNLGVAIEPTVLLDSMPTIPVIADVEHISLNETHIIFPSPETGWAYL